MCPCGGREMDLEYEDLEGRDRFAWEGCGGVVISSGYLIKVITKFR
jgi:hypothetical protein